MATVVLSENASLLNIQSSSLEKTSRSQLRESVRQKNLAKEVTLLTEAVKIRDDEIARLKNVISSLKHEKKQQRTALTTESDCDPAEHSDIRFSHFPLTSTIDSYREQLQTLKGKYSQSCNVISDLEGKLRTVMSNSKNAEEVFKSEIETLREDLKYLKQEHERSTDCLRIQMDHRQSERLKLVQNKYKQQMEILSEEMHALKQDSSEKGLEIIRLTEKIKKERSNNDGNVKFIENQNAQLRGKLENLSFEVKEEIRKREEGLIAQFQVDLQLLHQQQAGEIRILCDRIRILKTLLQEKDTQLKQLWKARNDQAQVTYSTNTARCEKPKPKPKESEAFQLFTIDKYLKS